MCTARLSHVSGFPAVIQDASSVIQHACSVIQDACSVIRDARAIFCGFLRNPPVVGQEPELRADPSMGVRTSGLFVDR